MDSDNLGTPRHSLDDRLCFNFYLGWRSIQAFYRPHLPGDLNPQRLYVLMVCGGSHALTVSEIASALHIDLPAVSGLLDRMVRDGLLRRRRAATNRREVRVVLTPEGERVRDANARAAIEATKTLLRYVSEEDVSVLRRIVRGILTAEAASRGEGNETSGIDIGMPAEHRESCGGSTASGGNHDA